MRWTSYLERSLHDLSTGVSLDVSALVSNWAAWEQLAPSLRASLAEMESLESGVIANPDEERMVGHYWLRASNRAPNTRLRDAIETAKQRVREQRNKLKTQQVSLRNQARIKP